MDQTNLHYYNVQESFKNLELSVDEENSDMLTASISAGRILPDIKEPETSCDALESVVGDSSATQVSGNRRFVLRPRKRLIMSETDNNDALVNMYNIENKRPKLIESATGSKRRYLETIFEEPVTKKNGSVLLIGASKLKRSITFSNFITKTKQKKRKAQIRKHKFKMGKPKNMKLSLKDVKSKLDEISSVDIVS